MGVGFKNPTPLSLSLWAERRDRRPASAPDYPGIRWAAGERGVRARGRDFPAARRIPFHGRKRQRLHRPRAGGVEVEVLAVSGAPEEKGAAGALGRTTHFAGGEGEGHLVAGTEDGEAVVRRPEQLADVAVAGVAPRHDPIVLPGQEVAVEEPLDLLAGR